MEAAVSSCGGVLDTDDPRLWWSSSCGGIRNAGISIHLVLHMRPGLVIGVEVSVSSGAIAILSVGFRIPSFYHEPGESGYYQHGENASDYSGDSFTRQTAPVIFVFGSSFCGGPVAFPRMSLVLKVEVVVNIEDVDSVVVVMTTVVGVASEDRTDVAVNASRSEVKASQRAAPFTLSSSTHEVCSGQQYTSSLSLSHTTALGSLSQTDSVSV